MNKYILQFWQISFTNQTNTFHNFDKFCIKESWLSIKHLKVIRVLQHPFWNWGKYLSQFEKNTFYILDKYISLSRPIYFAQRNIQCCCPLSVHLSTVRLDQTTKGYKKNTFIPCTNTCNICIHFSPRTLQRCCPFSVHLSTEAGSKEIS